MCTALLLNEIYLPMKFQVDISYSVRVMLRTKVKSEKLQRAITQKLSKQELWFFCTALLLNEIYLPMKFQIDISYSLRVMLRTKIPGRRRRRRRRHE